MKLNSTTTLLSLLALQALSILANPVPTNELLPAFELDSSSSNPRLQRRWGCNSRCRKRRRRRMGRRFRKTVRKAKNTVVKIATSPVMKGALTAAAMTTGTGAAILAAKALL
jgi:aconitase A